MKIISKEIFYVDGKEFDSEKKAKAHVYDMIGNKLDKMLSDAGICLIAKHSLAIVQALTMDARGFSDLLNCYVAPVESNQ